MSNPKSNPAWTRDQNPKWMSFPLRLLVYLLLVGLALVAEVRLVLRFGFEKVLVENTVVEWASVALCLLSALGFISIAATDRGRRGIGLVLALLAAAACVREMDFLLTGALSATAYHVLLALLLLAALIVAVLRRRSILHEGGDIMDRTAFVLLILGFAMITFWAQVLGQRELWGHFTKVYGPIDANGVKCMVEETIELIGYFLIFFGTVEEFIIKPTAED